MFAEILLAAASVYPPLAARAPYVTTYEATGDVTFQATATPGFLRVNGKGAKTKGRVEVRSDGAVTGTFTVKMAEFTTGLALRDEHLRNKYFEVAKYPDATVLVKDWLPSTSESPFTGTLTIKGIAKPIVGKASARDGHLIAEFVTTLKGFPIEEPKHLGVGVSLDSEITVSVEGDFK